MEHGRINNTHQEASVVNVNVLERLKLQLGVGDKTLFWLDCWAGELPLKTLFPSLFVLEQNKDILVKSCYIRNDDGVQWVWRWRRNPTTTQQQNELVCCLNLISNVPISTNPDCWLWKGLEGSTSSFLVKSLRWEIDNYDHQVIKSTFWLK